MAASFFAFKQFTIHQEKVAMKVTTPACLFGAWCAEKIKSYAECKTALDIGAGTGLLSLMIAQKNKIGIDAIDIDPAATLQARENLRSAGFSTVHVLEGDIRLLDLPVYDIIFSNPPFYENELKSPDAGRNIAHHSDNLSWEELFSFIKLHLDDKGKFFLLLPAKREKELKKLCADNDLHLHEIVFVKPVSTHPFSWMMVEGGKLASATRISEMAIRDENDYTPAFIALLKDYYLKL